MGTQREAKVAHLREQVQAHFSAWIDVREEIQGWFVQNQDWQGAELREYQAFVRDLEAEVREKLLIRGRVGDFITSCLAFLGLS